jgi:hypothetical protein
MKFAQEHMAALEPKLSRLTLVVPPEADEPGLELWLDGALVGQAARGVPTPIDPGRHVVAAKAPNKKEWIFALQVGEAADNKTITVPKLESATASPVPAAAATPPPESRAAAQAPTDVVERPVPTSVYVAGGATLALGVGAIVTGALYLDQRADYDRARAEDPDTARADHDSIQTLGFVNIALWAATAGGAALTGYFYLTRPERPASARLVPFVTDKSVGLVTAGEF